MRKSIHKTMLIVLDGVGEYKDYKGNAVKKAQKPYLDTLYKTYPWTLLQSSGHAVGLPQGVQGASEPGHLTMGAGRIVYQPFEEINEAIKNKSFYKKKEFFSCFSHVKKNNGTLHLIGMISPGGVHSHLNHLFELMKLAKKENVQKVYIHAIADGRDVPERSVLKYIRIIQQEIKKQKIGVLATIVGRYYAMDRDNNFDRTKVAYDLFVYGKGDYFPSAKKGIDHFYAHAPQDIRTDYYLTPIRLIDENKLVRKGDGIIFFNFRSDRARQLTQCFESKNFKPFPVAPHVCVPNISFVCMGPYSDKLPVAFPAPEVKNNVGSWISQHNLKQLRIAETEKFAHVTFFFNSQIHDPYPGEDRILVPSPKVPSYAEKPEMSAFTITKKILPEIKKAAYDFILLNFANGDLVGHSGDFQATKKAIEVLDSCLSKIIPLAAQKGYNIILTADHGNSEFMVNKDGSPNPSHTTFPVRCVIITKDKKKITQKKNLSIASIGSTVIKLMSLPIPPEMTAPPLF
jgi:2,3-bisphosphoglycerate-independent phosphoglycerate mutase